MSARQEAPDVVGDLATRVEDLPNVVVHDQVEVALPEASLTVLEAR